MKNLEVFMSKDILEIVENVKSGKTIIYIGQDLIMMNMAKYHEYLELEEEPVSKRILQAKCEEQEKVLSIIKEKCIVLEDTNIFTKEESKLLKEYLR